MYINLDLKVRETKQGGKKLTAPLEGWDQQMGCAFAIVFGTECKLSSSPN
jgi:hypothetical protein